MDRSIIKITRKDRIKYINIREKTGLKNIGYIFTKLKWKYVEHITKQKENMRKMSGGMFSV